MSGNSPSSPDTASTSPAEEANPETVVILNPQSGSGDHVEDVRDRAELRGFALERTERAGHAVDLAREAAAGGATTVVAAGGDGTINEVLQGLEAADALDDVSLGVVPAGTGNNFAANIGLPDIDTAFRAIDSGPRRRVDLGRAGDRPFVNSCIAGLTAESSGNTSSDLKRRLGVLAYVLTTLRAVADFESLRLSVEIDDGPGRPDGEHGEGGGGTTWSGEAICVLVGNGRRFSAGGSSQADMEDGRFEVTVIEDVPTLDLVGDALAERLLAAESDHLVRLMAESLTIRLHHPETIRFSLDGEMIERRSLSLSVRPRALELIVGESYESHPETA